MKFRNRYVENYFDSFFARKRKRNFKFNIKELGIKDRRITQELLRNRIEGKWCLDVGPGTGRWLQFLKQEGADYLSAIDISKESLKRCLSICDHVQQVNFELEEFPYKSDLFDIIISFEVIEHLRNPSLYLSEIYRVAKNNCLLLMSLPNIASFISRVRLLVGELPIAVCDPTHARFYREKDIVRLFQAYRMKPEFIATSISLNPFRSKSKFCLKSVKLLRTLDDSLLFKITINKTT